MTEDQVRALADKFIDEFQGSSGMQTFHDFNDEEFDPMGGFGDFKLEMLFWELVENFIFNCTQCGWWCETSDMAETEGEWICEDCHVENQND